MLACLWLGKAEVGLAVQNPTNVLSFNKRLLCARSRSVISAKKK